MPSPSPAPGNPRGLSALAARIDANQELVVGATYVVALFVTILDSTIVNVALPAMAAEFRVSPASIGWVVVGYLVSMAVWIPASGWIGDRVGTKRIFLLALGLFTVASMLCGLSGSLEQLILFRALQGGAAGMVSPVGTAMLFRAFPPERRAKIAGLLIVPTSLAPALGPLLGGILVDRLSWHWIFWINAPIGVVAVLFGIRFLHEYREPGDRRFDIPGFILSAAGLSLTLYALTEGSRHGWGSPAVLASGGIGLASLVALVFVELRTPEPLLNLRLLGERLFGISNLASFWSWSAYLGWLFLLPLYLQQVRQVGPAESGLTTFVEAVGVLAASRVVGRLYPIVGPRRLVAAGSAWIGLALLVATQLSDTTDTGLTRLLVFMSGWGMAGVLLPMNTAMFARISKADTGHASAIFNTQRRSAAAFGVAAMATILNSLTPTLATGDTPLAGAVLLPAFRVAFLVGAAFAAIGAVIALRIHDADAAATMHRRQA